MVALGEHLSWIRVGSNGADEVGTLPTNDFIWHSQGGVEVEHKVLDTDTAVDFKHLTRQIRNAMAKNKRREIVTTVLVDVGHRQVPAEVLIQLAEYNRVAVRRLTALWVMADVGLI